MVGWATEPRLGELDTTQLGLASDINAIGTLLRPDFGTDVRAQIRGKKKKTCHMPLQLGDVSLPRV